MRMSKAISTDFYRSSRDAAPCSRGIWCLHPPAPSTARIRACPFGTDHVDPVSLYAATKKANELMAHTYSHLFRIPSTGLRFFTVYGPWGRPDMAYFSFTKAILEGREIELFNRGEMERDFTYVDDVIEGMVRLLPIAPKPDPNWTGADPNPATSSAPYRIFNIGIIIR